MKIQIRARRLNVSEEDFAHARSRVEQALDRWADRIVTVVVEMEDVNGPRGGADKLVRVRADVKGPGEVIAESSDRDLATAVDLATTRLKAGVARFVARKSPTERRRRAAR